MNLKAKIREVKDYPKQGISFKDITTLIKDPEALRFVIDEVVEKFKGSGITKVVGLEARGFICGGAIAAGLGAGFVPVRKENKLPADVIREEYDLEYGSDVIEMHVDAVESGDVVLVHDDLLATGGSADAVLNLLEGRGVERIYFSFICDLDFIRNEKKDRILQYDNQVLVRYF